jgi:hypothetical protein
LSGLQRIVENDASIVAALDEDELNGDAANDESVSS